VEDWSTRLSGDANQPNYPENPIYDVLSSVGGVYFIHNEKKEGNPNVGFNTEDVTLTVATIKRP
jgi:hypothetical protein